MVAEMQESHPLLALKMLRRRLRCPENGVVVQSVPIALPNSRFTRDFEDLVARTERTDPAAADGNCGWKVMTNHPEAIQVG